jgi:hypothetical protein
LSWYVGIPFLSFVLFVRRCRRWSSSSWQNELDLFVHVFELFFDCLSQEAIRLLETFEKTMRLDVGRVGDVECLHK